MDFLEFQSRFTLAARDFQHNKTHDELAANAACVRQKLSDPGSLPDKRIVHGVMLAGTYPGMAKAVSKQVYLDLHPIKNMLHHLISPFT